MPIILYRQQRRIFHIKNTCRQAEVVMVVLVVLTTMIPPPVSLAPLGGRCALDGGVIRCFSSWALRRSTSLDRRPTLRWISA